MQQVVDIGQQCRILLEIEPEHTMAGESVTGGTVTIAKELIAGIIGNEGTKTPAAPGAVHLVAIIGQGLHMIECTFQRLMVAYRQAGF